MKSFVEARTLCILHDVSTYEPEVDFLYFGATTEYRVLKRSGSVTRWSRQVFIEQERCQTYKCKTGMIKTIKSKFKRTSKAVEV